MDKQTFFALLTDEAAKPDPVFIANLKSQVISLGGGTPPATGGSSSFFTSSKFIAGAIAATAATGVITYATLQNSEDPTPANTVISQDEQSSQEDTDSNPSDTADSSDTVQSQTDEDEQQDEVQDDQTNQQDQQDATDQQQDDQTQSSEGSSQQDASDPDPVIGTFTVEFWKLDPFKGAPVMQDTAPDATISGLSTINFDWGVESPDATISANHFVARATQVRDFEPGIYEVTINADDGVRFYIDGELVYDRWSNNDAGILDQFDFEINDFQNSTVVIEYYEHTDTARLIVDFQQI